MFIPQVPSTSHTPTSATQKKFDYQHLLCETAIPREDEPDDESNPDPDDTGSDTVSTVIARVNKLSELVAGLPCPSCRSTSLAVRAVNCGLGLVCQLQTYCTSCDDTINTTHSSDRIGGTAGHLPFVVTRAVVSASLNMGVGHSGIVKLCRYLDMNAVNQTTFAVHSQAIVDASMVVANNILTDAAKIVRRVYTDPSVAEVPRKTQTNHFMPECGPSAPRRASWDCSECCLLPASLWPSSTVVPRHQ